MWCDPTGREDVKMLVLYVCAWCTVPACMLDDEDGQGDSFRSTRMLVGRSWPMTADKATLIQTRGIITLCLATGMHPEGHFRRDWGAT